MFINALAVFTDSVTSVTSIPSSKFVISITSSVVVDVEVIVEVEAEGDVVDGDDVVGDDVIVGMVTDIH